MEIENKQEIKHNEQARNNSPIVSTPKMIYEIVEERRSKTARNEKFSNVKTKFGHFKNRNRNSKPKFILDGIKVGVKKLDQYNSLQDKHLIYFFKKKKVINHLIQMKIINRRGKIILQNPNKLIYNYGLIKENHKFIKMMQKNYKTFTRNELVQNMIKSKTFKRPQSSHKLPINHIYPELSQRSFKVKLDDKLNQIFPQSITKDITKLIDPQMTKNKIYSPKKIVTLKKQTK